MKRIYIALCTILFLIIRIAPIYAKDPPSSIYNLSTGDLVLTKGCQYLIPTTLKSVLSSFDYEILGDEDVIEFTQSGIIKAKSCGTVTVSFLLDNLSYSFDVSVYPPRKCVSDDIFAYPYLSINKELTDEERYLLQYEYDTLEPCIKGQLLAYKVPIILSDEVFNTPEYNDRNVVGLFSYEGDPYIIYVKANIEGIDSLIHEIGHFWSAINGGLCYSDETRSEFQQDPCSYNNYNPNSISEFYACKFKQQHMKNYKWYPYGLEYGYTH